MRAWLCRHVTVDNSSTWLRLCEWLCVASWLRLCGWLCEWLCDRTCVRCVALCILLLVLSPLLRPACHACVVLLSVRHVRVASVPRSLYLAPPCAALALCAHGTG